MATETTQALAATYVVELRTGTKRFKAVPGGTGLSLAEAKRLYAHYQGKHLTSDVRIRPMKPQTTKPGAP